MSRALLGASRIVEVGCGTGELCRLLKAWTGAKVIGSDLSEAAVLNCKRLDPDGDYVVQNIMTRYRGDNVVPESDLVIASNVLEHFRDPWFVLGKMLTIAPTAICIVPNEQPINDGYDFEGGPGHVHEFSTGILLELYQERVVDSFLFSSKGWQHSSRGETPMLFAFMVSL